MRSRALSEHATVRQGGEDCDGYRDDAENGEEGSA
jgi:hypothetical protein